MISEKNYMFLFTSNSGIFIYQTPYFWGLSSLNDIVQFDLTGQKFLTRYTLSEKSTTWSLQVYIYLWIINVYICVFFSIYEFTSFIYIYYTLYILSYNVTYMIKPNWSGLGASTLERAGRWQDALEILQRIKPFGWQTFGSGLDVNIRCFDIRVLQI